MEACNVTGSSSSNEVVLLIRRESHADVVTNICASVDNLRKELTGLGNELPKSHLFGATDSKLIVLGLPKLDIFDHSTPCQASRRLSEHRRGKGHLGNDVSVGHVPNKHLAVQGVSCREKQSVVMRECQVLYLMVMLRESVDSLFLLKVPDYDIGVLATLARRKQTSVVCNCQASDGVVVSGQEMLIVRVLNISDNDAASHNEEVLAASWVQVD